ncbi:Uncharacterised protein [Vibrio cholerae]|nr:Uncharacterised protein [Vibrio cholerae]
MRHQIGLAQPVSEQHGMSAKVSVQHPWLLLLPTPIALTLHPVDPRPLELWLTALQPKLRIRSLYWHQ